MRTSWKIARKPFATVRSGDRSACMAQMPEPVPHEWKGALCTQHANDTK
ncbi:hypothetical protein T261_05576 [Streptomyces lydicus]|nr:hypothetical protein T261_05576 [Streptomyces lydicus]